MATAADLAADSDLAAANGGPTLGDVDPDSHTIYYRNWSQAMRGLYYYNWVETHSGRYYWDKTFVWVDAYYLGFSGYHDCDQGSGFGYTIKVTNCPERPNNGPRTGGLIEQWDYFQVHVIASGIPIYRSYDMHANVYPSGNIYFHF